MSERRNVLAAKCPSAKCPAAKCPVTGFDLTVFKKGLCSNGVQNCKFTDAIDIIKIIKVTEQNSKKFTLGKHVLF